MRGADKNLVFHHSEESLIKSWRQKEHPVNGNRIWVWLFPDLVLTTGNCSTLPQCDKEGVVLYGLRSRDVNVNDDDDDFKT